MTIDGDDVTLSVPVVCPWGGCERETQIECDPIAYQRWRDGKLPIQAAFANMSPQRREQLKSGYCDEHIAVLNGEL